jgi:imidazolonepropionase
MPNSCRTLAARRWQPATARSADHLEQLDADGIAAMKQAGTVAVLLPGAFYFLRETHLPPIDQLRAAGVPIAIATDCNPGTSPLTSLLLTMNMAATLFRLTVEECLTAVTRNAARALGLGHETGTLEAGHGATSPSGTSKARPNLSIAWASTRSMPVSGEGNERRT